MLVRGQDVVRICERHRRHAVPIYNHCVGCEIEGLRESEAALHTDYAALEARHNALREAVAWERELDSVLTWLVRTGRYPKDVAGREDLFNERECARTEVDRLLGEGEG